MSDTQPTLYVRSPIEAAEMLLRQEGWAVYPPSRKGSVGPSVPPLALAVFTQRRRISAAIPQWQQVVEWGREGLVEILPSEGDFYFVALTDKGLAQTGVVVVDLVNHPEDENE